MTALNLGCSNFKLDGFINIDFDASCNPDLVLDARKLQEHFSKETVDFIFAGHFFEHFDSDTSLNIMKQAYSCLKKYGVMLIVVPDVSKCGTLSIEQKERVIMANGDHKMIFDVPRARAMLKNAGFSIVTEVTDLNEVPWLLVSNIHDPKPDPWQSAFLVLKK